MTSPQRSTAQRFEPSASRRPKARTAKAAKRWRIAGGPAGMWLILSALLVAVARAQPTPETADPQLARRPPTPKPTPTSVPASTVLTAFQAAELTVQASAALHADALAAREYAAASQETRAGWWPALSLTARYTRLSPFQQPSLGPFAVAPGISSGVIPEGSTLVAAESAFAAIVNQYLLQASVVLPVTDYAFGILERTRAAEHSEQAAHLRAAATERRVARDAGLVYFGYASAVAARDVSEESLDEARRRLRVVEHLLEAGKGRKVDVLHARARVATSQRLHTRAELLAQRYRRDLNATMERPPDDDWALSPGLNNPLPAMTADTLPELLDQALARRVELSAYQASRKAQLAQRDAERASALPRLDFFASAQYANPNLRFLPPQERWRATWDAGAQLSWTPNAWLRSRSRIAAHEAGAERDVARASAYAKAIQRELHEALQRAREADAAVASTRAEIAAAEEALRVSQQAHAAGAESLTAVQDAETALVAAKLARAQAVIAQRSARLQLAYATGDDLKSPDSWP